ncbi:MAG: sulfurtransferase [Gammaproteobacteria bacterium SHHR-1]
MKNPMGLFLLCFCWLLALPAAAVELIDSATLAQRLGQQSLLLIDAESPQDYRRAHIPGALNLHYQTLEDEDENSKTGLPIFPQLAASKLGALGISNDSRLVIYDQGNGRAASALWYILRFLGHERLAILDGGFRAWVAEQRPVTQQQPSPASANYVPRPDVGFALTSAELQQPQRLILDARSIAEYSGKEDGGARRAGHIPGALSFPWDRLGGDLRTFADEATQRARLKQAGIDPQQEIVTYCNGGLGRSTFLLLALERLGYTRVRVYPGSWSEWAADPARPIER